MKRLISLTQSLALIITTIFAFGCAKKEKEIKVEPITVQFRLVDESPESNAPKMNIKYRLVNESPGSNIPKYKIKEAEEIVHLCVNPVLDQTDITSASVREGVAGDYIIPIALTPEASKKLSEITANNIGRRVGIVVDGELLSAPVIKERISDGIVVIFGNFTAQEARNLAIRINCIAQKK